MYILTRDVFSLVVTAFQLAHDYSRKGDLHLLEFLAWRQ
jgi:hypothetical protein